jgi:hypothetical protein
MTEKTDPPTMQLDPTATLQEVMQLAKVEADAARTVQDYLKNRVLVLATQNSQLMAANTVLADQLGTLRERVGLNTGEEPK